MIEETKPQTIENTENLPADFSKYWSGPMFQFPQCDQYDKKEKAKVKKKNHTTITLLL